MSGSTLTFTVAVYEAEEGGYWAEVLELPGCASQGETLDELKDNITEAIEACLQARLEDEGHASSAEGHNLDLARSRAAASQGISHLGSSATHLH